MMKENAADGAGNSMPQSRFLPQILAPEREALVDIPDGNVPLNSRRSECQLAVPHPLGITLRILLESRIGSCNEPAL